MRAALALPALLLALAFAVPATAAAECKRIGNEPPAPGKAPELDGPGSFGPLHDTVTLDCLTYVGSIQMGGVEQVLIRDERGTVHHLKVGDPMGENDGVISRIDETTITITQRVSRGKGKWKEVLVRFPKK
jgi:hypothetical protein